MKVLHHVFFVGKGAGGLGPAIVPLVKAQRAEGMSNELWTLDPIEEEAFCEGLLPVADGRRRFDTVGPHALGYSPAGEAAVKASSFDLVHQHSIWTANARWNAASKKPYVVAPHGTLQAFALQRSQRKKALAKLLYETQNLGNAACFHALATMEVDDIRQYGLKNPVAVIPNGVAPEWFAKHAPATEFLQKHGVEAGEKVLLFLSRIHPKKGLDILLQALADIKFCDQGWKVVIVGPDEIGHQAELEILRDQVGLQRKVVFTGPIFGGDRYGVYHASDAFVLPSYSEGSPMAVLEAMASNLPVLTTTGTPWKNLNELGAGWCVEPTRKTLAEGLDALLGQSDEERALMGAKGRAIVERDYTIKAAAQKTVKLYEWILGGGPPPEFVLI